MLVAGMIAGADSIDDIGLLRHGGTGRLLAAVRTPSTLGTVLRCFTFGHVRQLNAVVSAFLANRAGHTPLLPGADQIALGDLDDIVRENHGYAEEDAGYGCGGKGLNALLATVGTPTALGMAVPVALTVGRP